MLVALLASCIDEYESPDRQFIVKVGDDVSHLLDFEMELFGDGTVNLADYKGRVILIHFATWYCGMTKDKMRQVEPRIWQPHKNNPNFKLLGIARGDVNTDENLQKMMDYTEVTYPIALDLNRDFFARFARRDGGATRDILIGKDGRIVMLTRYFGRDNMVEFNALVAKINELLAD